MSKSSTSILDGGLIAPVSRVDLSLPKREESDRPGAVAEGVGLGLDWF